MMGGTQKREEPNPAHYLVAGAVLVAFIALALYHTSPSCWEGAFTPPSSDIFAVCETKCVSVFGATSAQTELAKVDGVDVRNVLSRVGPQNFWILQPQDFNVLSVLCQEKSKEDIPLDNWTAEHWLYEKWNETAQCQNFLKAQRIHYRDYPVLNLKVIIEKENQSRIFRQIAMALRYNNPEFIWNYVQNQNRLN